MDLALIANDDDSIGFAMPKVKAQLHSIMLKGILALFFILAVLQVALGVGDPGTEKKNAEDFSQLSATQKKLDFGEKEMNELKTKQAIDVPTFCPEGQKPDRKGRCKTIY